MPIDNTIQLTKQIAFFSPVVVYTQKKTVTSCVTASSIGGE